MAQLDQERCTACRADAPRVQGAEAQALLAEIPDWQLVEQDGVPQLRRAFACTSYAQALAMTAAVGELAEEQGHHPRLITEYKKVTVEWWTHKIRGLHRNDFVMAAKTDAMYRRLSAD